MKIVVNEVTFANSTWSFDHERGVASLIITTNDSLGEIASAFDGDDTIRAYDNNDIETGVWYVHSLVGIYEDYSSHTAEDPRKVIVMLKASALTTEAEESLGASIDETSDAIMELAELIADMDEANVRINNIEGVLEGIPKDIVAHFGQIESAYNALADRIARLENKN